MNKALRYGIIGSGSMGREHIENLNVMDGVAVTAISDPYEPSRKAALALAPDAKSFTSHQDLLSSGLVDAVVIATPNDTHVDVLQDALNTDLAVFIEKPLATRIEDCKKIIEWNSRRKAFTWMGLEYRFMPPVNEVVQRTKNGDIGNVKHVSIREHREPFYPKVNNWNRFSDRTGGTLVEKCCHYFNLMDLVIGEHPTTIYASGSQMVNHLDENYDGKSADMIDSAFVILEYANGARAMLDLCMFGEGSHDKEIFTVVGDSGKLESFLPSHNVRYSKRADWGKALSWGAGGRGGSEQKIVLDLNVKYLGHHYGASYIEHVKFRDAILQGKPPEVTLEDGVSSVAIGLAAHKSIAEKRPIQLNEILN